MGGEGVEGGGGDGETRGLVVRASCSLDTLRARCSHYLNLIARYPSCKMLALLKFNRSIPFVQDARTT